jgi:excisionase family DNA binding protein
VNQHRNLPDPSRLITKQEAAKRIGVAQITIDRALASGKLQKYHLENGFSVRVSIDEVDRLVVRRASSGPVSV